MDEIAELIGAVIGGVLGLAMRFALMTLGIVVDTLSLIFEVLTLSTWCKRRLPEKQPEQSPEQMP